MTTDCLPIYPLSEDEYKKSKPTEKCPSPVLNSGIDHCYWSNTRITTKGYREQICMGCKKIRIVKE